MLLTRAQPWTVTVGHRPATLRAVSSPFPFEAMGSLRLRCAGGVWRVDLGGTEFIRSHPSIAAVPLWTDLPDAVRLAVLDLILTPLLEPLQRLMGDAATLAEATLEPGETEVDNPAALAHLVLEFSDAEHDDAPVPLRVAIPDRQSALLLCDRLADLPVRSAGQGVQERPDLPISVCVDAGSMPISIRELSSLEQGDILLPPDYLGAQGRIILRPCPPVTGQTNPPAGAAGVLCSINDTQATVVTAVSNPQEIPMTTTDPSETTAPAEDQAGLDVGGIDVELCFELERRTMTVADLAALVPGYTFTLGCDPLSPVSLRINGAVVGTGRLVDINGVLGVQVDSLARKGGQDGRG
jgi:type III secretion protein Q